MPSAINTRIAICLLPFFFILFTACNRNDNEKVIKAMEESLASSNESISMSTAQVLHSLQEKKYEPGSIDRAEIWFPKAESICHISKTAFNYLEGLKAGNAVDISRVFETLRNYKDSTMKVDSSILLTFSKKNILPSCFSEIDSITKESFNKRYFSKTNDSLKKAILTRFQNDIRITENKIVNFCNAKIGHTHGYGLYEIFATIAVLNKNYVGPGEKLEVTAGVGSFSTKVSPIITINRKQISTNETGAAYYSFKASLKPGKHYVPVKIEFSNQDGRQQVVEKTIEYTVAKPCDQ